MANFQLTRLAHLHLAVEPPAEQSHDLDSGGFPQELGSRSGCPQSRAPVGRRPDEVEATRQEAALGPRPAPSPPPPTAPMMPGALGCACLLLLCVQEPVLEIPLPMQGIKGLSESD